MMWVKTARRRDRVSFIFRPDVSFTIDFYTGVCGGFGFVFTPLPFSVYFSSISSSTPPTPQPPSPPFLLLYLSANKSAPLF